MTIEKLPLEVLSDSVHQASISHDLRSPLTSVKASGVP